VQPCYNSVNGWMTDPNNKNPALEYWFNNPYPSPPAFAGPSGTIYKAASTKIKTFMCPSGRTDDPKNNANGAEVAPSGGTMIGGPMVRNLAPSTVVTTGFWYDDWNGVEPAF